MPVSTAKKWLILRIAQALLRSGTVRDQLELHEWLIQYQDRLPSTHPCKKMKSRNFSISAAVNCAGSSSAVSSVVASFSLTVARYPLALLVRECGGDVGVGKVSIPPKKALRSMRGER
jgi:hypothetical protein